MGQLVERQRPLRRQEYERMIDAGLFRDERIELIRGVIVSMSPQNAPHSGAIQVLTRVTPHQMGQTLAPLAFPDAAVPVAAVFGA